jgi:triacylglycerol lipase
VPLIEEYGLVDRVGVESFWPESLARVKELNPKIRTVFLTLGSAAENYAYVAQTTTEYSSSDTLAPDYNQTYVDNVHALGREVTPWLVDTLADTATALAFGVDGVYTSHVACMLQGFGRPVPSPIVTPEAGVAYDLLPCGGKADASAIAALKHAGGPASGRPVLLVHGTDSTAGQSWPTTYVPALAQAGYAVFTIDLPVRALGDIQDSSEFLVVALRHLASITGRRVSIVGHSQGGLEPRWALRWFPELRDRIEDVISLGTPQHGTQIANLNCLPGCPPSNWQMAVGSNFLAALNRDGLETPGGAEYTSIYSANDELVQPQLPESTSALQGAANVMVQDVCPNHAVNHVALMRDPVAYALVVDALTHAGGADPSRIPVTVCAEQVIPGVDPVAQFSAEEAYVASFTDDAANYNTDSEPPVRYYAQAK